MAIRPQEGPCSVQSQRIYRTLGRIMELCFAYFLLVFSKHLWSDSYVLYQLLHFIFFKTCNIHVK